jgi:ankyrin repeat protein
VILEVITVNHRECLILSIIVNAPMIILRINQNGLNALLCAVEHGQLDMAQHLIEMGCNIHHENKVRSRSVFSFTFKIFRSAI